MMEGFECKDLKSYKDVLRSGKQFSEVITDEVREELDKALKIDTNKIQEENARIINMSQHYNELLIHSKFKLKKYQMSFDVIVSNEYSDIHKNHPLGLKSRIEIETVMRSRKTYVKMKTILTELEAIVEFYESAVAQCRNATFAVRNIIEDRKLVAGVS